MRGLILFSGSNGTAETIGLVGDCGGQFGELGGYPVLSPQSNGPRALNDYEVGPDSLMPNFAGMEIDPINIQLDKNLGEGEFAEVKHAYIVNKLGERIPVAAKMLKSGVGMRAQLDFLGKTETYFGLHRKILPLVSFFILIFRGRPNSTRIRTSVDYRTQRCSHEKSTYDDSYRIYGKWLPR